MRGRRFHSVGVLPLCALLAAHGLAAAALPPRPADLRPTAVLQAGHAGTVWTLRFSPDGRTFATGSSDGTVRVWDTASGALTAVLEGFAGVYSPDGRRVATRAAGSRVWLWSAATGRPEGSVGVASGWVTDHEFAPGGLLAVATMDNNIRLWDSERRLLKATLPGHTGRINALAFSRDGRVLASASADGTARLWDVSGRRLLGTLPNGENVVALGFSPDGQLLVTGTAAARDERGRLTRGLGARVWSVATRELLEVLQEGQAVPSICFSPKGRLLATSAPGETAYLWDLSGVGQRVPLRPSATLTGVWSPFRFSADGRWLATGSPSSSVLVWDVQAAAGLREPALRLPGHQTWLNAVTFDPRGGALVTGDDNGEIRAWNARTGAPRFVRPGLRSVVWDARLSPDRTSLATGHADRAARLWDLTTGQLKFTLRGHAWDVGGLAFGPGGKLLASGGADGTVQLWETSTGRLAAVLGPESAHVMRSAFAPDGTLLAAICDDHAVRLWDLRSQPPPSAPRALLRGHGGTISEMRFSRDSRLLATAAADGTVRLWNPRTGEGVAVLEGHLQGVQAIAFSADGGALASVDGRNVLRLWSAPAGKLRTTLEEHAGQVRSVAFSAGGAKVVVAGAPPGMAGRVRVYGVAGGVWRLLWDQSQESGAREAAFSPDGKRVAAADDVGRVFLRDAASGRRLPIRSRKDLAGLPDTLTHPITFVPGGVSVRDPETGAVLATLTAVPGAALAAPRAAGASSPPASVTTTEWIAVTPEGYFDCSANALPYLRWNRGGVLSPSEDYVSRYRRPDLVRRALRGERILVVPAVQAGVPPRVRFVGLRNGALVSGEVLPVTVDATDDRAVTGVELLVDGRPLKIARGQSGSPRGSGIGSGAAAPGGGRYRFRVPLPDGVETIRLKAWAFDDSGLASSAAEVALRRPAAAARPGNLVVLSVGVSRYRSARPVRTAGAPAISDLAFAAADAQAITARFKREGPPLYQKVHVRTLTDRQATLAGVRAGLRWVQRSVREGQVDTVVVFLAGHAQSRGGRYYFAPHDYDPVTAGTTGLSGPELREALGPQLRARRVFLFVDTCYAGGLTAQSNDLALEFRRYGSIYVMASCGATEEAFELPRLRRGAFTAALLKATSNRALAPDGVVRFNDLVLAVPDEIARSMRDSGRSEAAQTPCIPLEGRDLRAPLCRAAP
jgi:WD40 repeat protein